MSRAKKKKLINIANKTPIFWINEIVKNGSKPTVSIPELKINCMGVDRSLIYLDSKSIYRLLISKFIKLQKSLVNWCLELELTDIQIHTTLLFAHNCCMNSFDKVFQYIKFPQIYFLQMTI